MTSGPAAATDLSPDDGWTIVEGTWESILRSHAVPADPATVLDDPLTASVAVAGDPARTVTFSFSRPAGEDVARTMLDLRADEVVTDDDVEDATGEIVNILGGNVKSVLVGATALGLPRVVAGGVRPTGTPLWRTAVAWSGHVATVALWRNGSDDSHDNLSTNTHDDEGKTAP